LILDAPKFEGRGLQGITIHGRNAAADFLALILQHCYQIHQTEEMPPHVAKYYRRLHPTTIAATDVFVWLEIGKGLPFPRWTLSLDRELVGCFFVFSTSVLCLSAIRAISGVIKASERLPAGPSRYANWQIRPLSALKCDRDYKHHPISMIPD
jgi:hypothetical protein